jgi:hypothetical protein
MRVDSVTATRSSFGPEQCLTGVSAALADARQVFRKVAPDVSWTDVTARANGVRAANPMTFLQALAVVHNEMIAGR